MLSRGGKQSKRRTSWSMISQSSRRGRVRVLTKAGLTTKGTKTSITYSRLAHRWDTKLRSMKPPTRDWSSGHQSHWCKSSLFQTSGVLIQASPRGELLVRNRYSSWRGGGPLTHLLQRPARSEKYLIAKGLKSLSASSSTDLPGEALTQLCKVQTGFAVPKLHSRTRLDHSSLYFR